MNENNENKVVIEFKNVTKRYKLYKSDKQRLIAVFSKRVKYKEKLAVNNVSFQIRQGESVAFLGKNGAGNSEKCHKYRTFPARCLLHPAAVTVQQEFIARHDFSPCSLSSALFCASAGMFFPEVSSASESFCPECILCRASRSRSRISKRWSVLETALPQI